MDWKFKIEQDGGARCKSCGAWVYSLNAMITHVCEQRREQRAATRPTECNPESRDEFEEPDADPVRYSS